MEVEVIDNADALLFGLCGEDLDCYVAAILLYERTRVIILGNNCQSKVGC